MRLFTKRAFLALALVAMIGVAAVSSAKANDLCSPCTAPIRHAPVVTVAANPYVCDLNMCSSTQIARTDLPGIYSNDYDYSVSSQIDTGVTYLIPTQTGFVESNRIPLTNPVDQYYATHRIINGDVVAVTNADGATQMELASAENPYQYFMG